MTYTLHRLAAGSYDFALDHALMGSVVQEVSPGGRAKERHVELLLPAELRPPPFTHAELYFPTLEAALAWLGDAFLVEGD